MNYGIEEDEWDSAFDENDDSNPTGQWIKETLDLEAEESITDEMVERVLALVLMMIREGRFDKHLHKKKRAIYFPQIASRAAGGQHTFTYDTMDGERITVWKTGQ